MTYEDWQNQHAQKVKALVVRLQDIGLSDTEIVQYFSYDNMKAKEPDFCMLYKQGKKCHDIDNLNCLLCACPYFEVVADYDRLHNILTKSKCRIKSKFANTFKNGIEVHCDCSNCTIPHTEKAALTHLHEYKQSKSKIEDTFSFLDKLRHFQLSSLLKKFKIF